MPPDADVLIVGAGPAGLSAALVLGRACRRVLVFDDQQPRNRFAAAIHGYLTRDGVSPGEFLQMLPYAVTLVVVAGLIGKAKAPAADGVPYNPGDK